MPRTSTSPRYGIPACAGLVALPLAAGAFVSTGWSWGWDHLHRAPAAWPMLLALLAATAGIPPVSQAFLSAWDRMGTHLGRHRLAGPLAVTAFAATAFAAFPIATRMYGDSHAILLRHTPGALAQHARQFVELGVQSRGAAVYLLHDGLERLTGMTYEHCFMAVSIVCGALFVAAHLRLAATLPGLAGWARLAIAWLGLTDGANQVFFGHVETYAAPRLVACLFLITLTREALDPGDARRRRTLWLLLAAAIVLHAQWVVLLPAGLLLLARDMSRRDPRWRPLASGRAAAVAMASALLLLAVVYVAAGAPCYDYLYTGGAPQLRQVFLPLDTGCTQQPFLRYTLFSASHLLDFAGSFYSISSPAILLAILLLLPGRRGADGLVLLLPTVAAGLLHNFLINTSIGNPFDWDLLCVASPPLLYTAVYLVALAGRDDRSLPVAVKRPPAWLVPLFLLGLATATLFAVNASAARAYARVEDMAVWLHRSYYGNSHYRLSANLSTIGDPERQDSERQRVLERLRPQSYPDDREVAFLWEKLGSLRAERGLYPGAIAAFHEALRRQPSGWQRARPAGYLEISHGDPAEGIRLLEAYLQRAPDDAGAWLNLGDAFAVRGDADRARACRERFLQLAPNDPAAAAVRSALALPDQDPPR